MTFVINVENSGNLVSKIKAEHFKIPVKVVINKNTIFYGNY